MTDPTNSNCPAVSVLDSLAQKAAPVVSDQATKWVGYLADGLKTSLVPLVPAATQGALLAAIQALKDNEAILGQTTAHGFTALVSHLAAGREDQARLVWLSSAADFDSDMQALDDAYFATRAAAKARADTWATVKSIALAVLEAGGKALVPVLLGMVSL